VAISPDKPAKLAESRQSEGLGYALYSDSFMHAAKAFGIAFDPGLATRTGLKVFGIDLFESSGEDHGLLPVPSVFLVAKGGEILWVYSNPDYKVRPDNDAVMAAARAASGRTASER